MNSEHFSPGPEPEIEYDFISAEWIDHYRRKVGLFATLGRNATMYLAYERFMQLMGEKFLRIPRTIVGIGEGQDPISLPIAKALMSSPEPIKIMLFDPAYEIPKIQMEVYQKTLNILAADSYKSAESELNDKYPNRKDLISIFNRVPLTGLFGMNIGNLGPTYGEFLKYCAQAVDVYKNHLPNNINLQLSDQRLPYIKLPETNHILCFQALANYVDKSWIQKLLKNQNVGYLVCSNGINYLAPNIAPHEDSIDSSIELWEMGSNNGFGTLDLLLTEPDINLFKLSERTKDQFPELGFVMKRVESIVEAHWLERNNKLWYLPKSSDTNFLKYGRDNWDKTDEWQKKLIRQN